MPALSDFDLASLEGQLSRWGINAAHARGLLRQFYDASGKLDYAQLDAARFGRAALARLAKNLPPRQSHIAQRYASADQTVKLLVEFAGGGAVECVLMPALRSGRAAGCVSSQIGCAMECDFCASTLGGMQRNLSSGEIVEQYLHLRQIAADAGRRLNTLVFMGMGEPMLNLPDVMAALRRIAQPETGALGWRQITLSTVGIVPGIEELGQSGLNVHLALSLHAPDDATRSRLIPANRRWPVQEVMTAARHYQQITGRVCTIEYCLIEQVNDSDAQAQALAQLMQGFRAHVNLIPYNPVARSVSGVVYRRPDAGRVWRFLQLLHAAGVVAHVRRPRGDDVSAACGQLAGKYNAAGKSAPPGESPRR